MKKTFEIDINEDFKRAIISQYFLMIFTLLLSIVIRTHEKSVIEFSFLVEISLLGFLFKSYFSAQKHRNYAYWGITFIIAGYLLMNVLHYTFVEYEIFILYISFLAAIFLVINSYVMSSPLFYPRVQWWEYDFRFRGDLKAVISIENKKIHGRVTDLRRGCASIDAFKYFSLNSEVLIEIQLNTKTYLLNGTIKTTKQVTPGRPIRYGVKFSLNDESRKHDYIEIKKIWDENKKAKFRNKFTGLENDEI